MRKTRLLSIFVVLAIIASATPVYAVGGHPPSKSDAVIVSLGSKEGGNITNADIAKVVDLIMTNRITVEQLAGFMAKLDKQQIGTMRALFSERTGIEVQATDPEHIKAGSGAQAVAAYTYVETIENVWTWNYNPKIFAS